MRRRLATCLVLLSVAACGDGDSDGVTTAEPTGGAAAQEVACFSGAYEPAGQGTAVPSEEACPEGSASASPSTSPSTSPATSPTSSASPTPAPGPVWDPTAAFLSPQAATEAEHPGWRVDEGYAPEAGALLDPCGDGGFPRADDIEASDERAMGSRREVGGSGLAQEVFRYSSPQAAADALAGYAEAVERCPEQQAPQSPEGYTNRYSVVEQTTEQGVRRLLVRRQPCAPPDLCTAHFRSYLFAAQTGDGLTVADYGIGEDGDPESDARALLDAAAEQLAATVERA